MAEHSREVLKTDVFYSSDQQLTEEQLADDLREGLADIAAGRTRPAREVFAELREESGIRD